MSIPWALLPISFRIPRKSPPNRPPAKKDAPFPEPSNYLLKSPVSGLPRFANRSLRGEASVSRSFFYTYTSESPVNEPLPPPCSPTGSLWREKLHLQSQWFIHSFIHSLISVGVPKKEPFYILEPHAGWRPTCNGVRPGSPRGSFMTLLSLSHCYAAFGTIPSNWAWIDQSPVSQHVS